MRFNHHGRLRGLLAVAVLLAMPMAAHADEARQSQAGAIDTSRIVSIGGDVTEILYGGGFASKIVAVDSTSQFPPEALREKKNVGYMRALSTEGVLSMNPSVIIATERAGPPEVVAALKASPVPYVEVRDRLEPEGVAEKVRFVARTVGATAEGEALAARVENDFRVLAEERAKIGKPVRALFVLTVQGGRAVVGGKATSADAIIRLAGGANAADGLNGFKPLVDEAAIELAPDVIVAMKSSGGPRVDRQMLESVQGLRATPAVANGRVIEMDGLYVLGFGPRAARAARDLMRLFYPASGQGAGNGQ